MGATNVKYEEMHNAAGQLVKGYNDVNDEMNRLAGVIDQLSKEGFVTDLAGPAFEGAFTEFKTGMVAALKGLEDMSDYLNKAADNYADVDKHNASLIHR